MYPAISEGKSKGVQETGLHHKNNKIQLFIAVCSLYFLSLFLEWIVQQLLAGIISSEVLEIFDDSPLPKFTVIQFILC